MADPRNEYRMQIDDEDYERDVDPRNGSQDSKAHGSRRDPANEAKA
jgi:hypothetical protein